MLAVLNLQPIRDDDFNSDEELDLLLDKAPRREILELSEENRELVKKVMTATLSKQECRDIRNRYLVPETDVTRVPKLDEILKSSESKSQKHSEAKAVEKDLIQIQSCSLDVARPPIDLIEGLDNDRLAPEGVRNRAIDALALVGNAV